MVATQAKRMTEAEYREFSLGAAQGQWELVQGELRERSGMSVEHRVAIMRLLELLLGLLDRRDYRLSTTHARLRRSAETYYVPDLVVIPAALEQALIQHPGSLDAYPEPLPLVIEVWSPSTGRHDMNAKLGDYQQRGDLEIWYSHPYNRTLTAWRRQPDGAYLETVYREGIVRSESLPMVVFELGELFEP